MKQFLLSLFVAARFASAAHAAPAKPDVIFFLVDDMGWVDCGAYGSQYYETPRIDAFAKRAMKFTNAYAQPLCSPSRCSLLTGQYSARHGITSATGHRPPQPEGFHFLPDTAPANAPMLLPESKNYMEPSQYTLAEALHDAGYRTAHIGKWHLGLTQPHWPEQQGFDTAFHCHPDPGPPGGYFSPYGVVPDGKPNGKTRVGTITDGPSGEYIVDRLADESIKFIRASKDQPFFLNLWNYGVHGPWGHKLEYTKYFAQKKDPRGIQKNPIMASMLRSVDECFGRILDELDKLGIADNTIIIFNSDNGGNSHSNTGESGKDKRKAAKSDEGDGAPGDWRKWAGHEPPTWNTPLREGKGTLYEGGTRVPLMWAWAGKIKPGTVSDEIVGHIDLYPTLLELLGLPKPAQQKIDGVSYAPVLKGTGGIDRKAFFNYFPHGQSPGKAGGVSARSGDWKLIRWFGVAPGDPQRFELYNLRDDLSETKNLAAEQPDRVKDLDTLIDGFLTDTGATYPRPNPAFTGTVVQKAAATADPLEAWKARACEASVANGVLTMKGATRAGAAFLGHGMVKTEGPLTVKLRVRSSVGGEGKIDIMSADKEHPSVAQTAPLKVAPGDWQEVSANLPAPGPLGTLRIYLPATQPIDIDWIEAKPTTGRPMRWDFSAK